MLQYYIDRQVKALIDELRSNLDVIPVATSHAKSWGERREQVEQSWEGHWATIFEDVVTSMTLSTDMVWSYACIINFYL